MLMTVEEFKMFVKTDLTDALLEKKLAALELAIRKNTNNNFQNRGFRASYDIRGKSFISESLTPFEVGDTVMITESRLQEDRLCTVESVDELSFTVNEKVYDENNVLVTKVEYPEDVKLGAVDILKWKLKNEAANDGDTSKKEIQSETLSRYSVTYAQDTTEKDIDPDFGVPRKYTAFLREYEKARF